MKRLALALLLLAPLPAAADEVEDVLTEALEAYRAGEIGQVQEDLAYALQLVGQMQAEGLAGFLPEAQEGWTREIGDAGAGSAAMAMMGGGSTATADYVSDEGESFTLTLVADSPMVAGMAAMIPMAGRVQRVHGQPFSTAAGEAMGVVEGRVLVQAKGDAPADAMLAHIEAMDFEALAAF